MKTTLNKIRHHSPCKGGWKKLLSSLGKTKADDEPLQIMYILESNGLDDALWCLRAVDGLDREKRLFAVWCARQVQHLMHDQRSIDALDVAEKYANGEATEDELRDARGAARDAGGAAGGAAWVAAWVAGAAGDAGDAGDAGEAAWGAAGGAAWVAVRDAVGWYAAREAARAAQKTEFLKLLDCIESGKRYEI